MNALLDTSVLVDIYRNHSPAVNWMTLVSNQTFGISTMAWLEMMEGVQNKPDQVLLARFLGRFVLVYPTQADMNWGMQQLSNYWLSHHIDAFDCLIAAPSRRLGLPLMTRNLKHFTPLLGNLAQQPY